MANEGWHSLFPQAEVLVEGAVCSDHLPLFVTLHSTKQLRRPFRKFIHDAAWALEGTYTEIIKPAWKIKYPRAECWENLCRKLGSCQVELKKW